MLWNITSSLYIRVKVWTGAGGCQFTDSAALLPWEPEIPACIGVWRRMAQISILQPQHYHQTWELRQGSECRGWISWIGGEEEQQERERERESIKRIGIDPDMSSTLLITTMFSYSDEGRIKGKGKEPHLIFSIHMTPLSMSLVTDKTGY